METFMWYMELLGTVAFSISGSIEAMKKQMDLLGVMILGVVTAVGGGIIRDMVIGKLPPTAFRDPLFAGIAAGVAVLAFLVGVYTSRYHHINKIGAWNNILFLSDSIGLAVFTVMGIQSVQDRLGNDNTALLLFVGVVTGVGGGVIRDLFAGNVPAILRKHVYATASIVGAVLYLLTEELMMRELAASISMAVVVIVRILAAHYEWSLPRVKL